MDPSLITIVDFGAGNLFSLEHAFRHLGYDVEVTAEPLRVLAAERIVLPGVGAFGDGMAGLAARALIQPLQRKAGQGTPFLGICLGFQLFATKGEEFGEHEGLGIIPGRVKRLPDGDGGDCAVRIPNIGWRALELHREDCFSKEFGKSPMAYFVHSYSFCVDQWDCVTASIPVNGHNIVAAVQKDRVFGFQFHPEKSGDFGLDLLKRFARTNSEHRTELS